MQIIDQGLITKMIRAAKLDVTLYEEVEHDQSATQAAAVVVGIVAVANAIGSLIGIVFGELFGRLFGGGNAIGTGWAILNVVLGLVFTVIAWVVWSYLTWFIGTRMFKGTAEPGELLRTLGFATAPNILGALSFIPCLGLFAWLGGLAWMLVAGVIAVRQALDIDTGESVVTVLLAAIPMVMVMALMVFIQVLGAVFVTFLGSLFSGAR